MQSEKTNWLWRSFVGVMGALILGVAAAAVGALVWSVFHWDSSDELPWTFGLVAFGPAALVLLGTIAAALKDKSDTGESALAPTLVGGIVMPIGVVAAIAGVIWFNGYQDQRAAEERQQLSTDFTQFLDEAGAGFPALQTGEYRYDDSPPRLVTLCDEDDELTRGRLIAVDDALAAAEHLHTKLIDDGYQTELRRFRGPAGIYEVVLVIGVDGDNYVRTVADLTPDPENQRLTIYMATGSCVDDRGLTLVSRSQPGSTMEPNFDPPQFAAHTRTPIANQMWTQQAIPRGNDGYERRCPGADIAGIGLSRVWTADDLDDPHAEAVQFLADTHATLVADGWDTSFAQHRPVASDINTPPSEERIVEARRDDSLFRVTVNFTAAAGTSITAGDGPKAAVHVGHLHGRCIGTLDLTEPTGDGWSTVTDPYAFDDFPTTR
jgi:hypothetical protein